MEQPDRIQIRSQVWDGGYIKREELPHVHSGCTPLPECAVRAPNREHRVKADESGGWLASMRIERRTAALRMAS